MKGCIIQRSMQLSVFPDNERVGSDYEEICKTLAKLLHGGNELRAKFKLEGQTKGYAVCSQCHSLYAPTLDVLQLNSAYVGDFLGASQVVLRRFNGARGREISADSKLSEH